MTFDVTEKGTPAFDGKATRRQVTIYLTADHSGPKIDLLEYLPAAAKKPVPLLLGISFTANSSAVDDPGVKEGTIWDATTKTRIPASKGRAFGKINVLPLIEAGFGFATFYYGDVDPDFLGGVPLGIRAKYLKPGQTDPAPDEWGAIAAWGWGMSRVMDYLETDKTSTPNASPSTASPASARPSCGPARTTLASPPSSPVAPAKAAQPSAAATTARPSPTSPPPRATPINSPPTTPSTAASPTKHPLTPTCSSPSSPRARFSSKPATPTSGPIPKGEFVAAVDAGRVYKLLGKDGLDTTEWPAAKTPILHDLAYYMHDGGHGMVPTDWDIYIDFLKMHLKPNQ